MVASFLSLGKTSDSLAPGRSPKDKKKYRGINPYGTVRLGVERLILTGSRMRLNRLNCNVVKSLVRRVLNRLSLALLLVPSAVPASKSAASMPSGPAIIHYHALCDVFVPV